MLRLSLQVLADRSGVAVRTIQRFESVDGEVHGSDAAVRALTSYLEAAGVIFARDERGAGVFLSEEC